MRRPLLIANWKMNKTVEEARTFAGEILAALHLTGIDMVICPPFTCLQTLGEALKGSPIALGAQNLFWEEKGAYTGEISPGMLADLGCSYVIAGHSERRQILGESDVNINRKIKAALDASLIPVLCVGETLQERDNNLAREIVKDQLTKDLKDIELARPSLVVAYEPVWAIGTGINASSDDAQEMIGFIRNYLEKLYTKDLAQAVRILYGGSVNEENTARLMAEPDIDGALVGGASLQAASFAAIARLTVHE